MDSIWIDRDNKLVDMAGAAQEWAMEEKLKFVVFIVNYKETAFFFPSEEWQHADAATHIMQELSLVDDLFNGAGTLFKDVSKDATFGSDSCDTKFRRHKPEDADEQVRVLQKVTDSARAAGYTAGKT
jgi:hypothetical protein